MNKKYIFILVGICVVSVLGIIVYNSRKTTSPEKLIKKLENAINECDVEKLIECFPDFMRNEVSSLVSQEKMKEFYNNVIRDNNLVFQIIHISEFDLDTIKLQEESINEKYEDGIKLADYQLIQVQYHEDSEMPIYEIIKIGKEYYLYSGGYYPSPISYFLNKGDQL